MLHRQRPTPCLRALPPMTAQIATALGPTLDEPGALQQSSTVHVSEGSNPDDLPGAACPVSPAADMPAARAPRLRRTSPTVTRSSLLDNTFALKHAKDFVKLRTDIVSSEPAPTCSGHFRTRAGRCQDVVEIADLAGRRADHQGGRHGTGRF